MILKTLNTNFFNQFSNKLLQKTKRIEYKFVQIEIDAF